MGASCQPNGRGAGCPRDAEKRRDGREAHHLPNAEDQSAAGKRIPPERVFGKDEFVELAAHKLSEGSDNESARWHGETEICTGRSFIKALRLPEIEIVGRRSYSQTFEVTYTRVDICSVINEIAADLADRLLCDIA